MEKLTHIILEYLWDETEIPEDLLYEFTVKTTKVIKEGCAGELPSEFWELEKYVESFWRAQNFQSVDATKLYEMGRLLSLTNMLGMAAEEEERRQSLSEYAVKFREWYLVFKRMHDMPGITHNELAKFAKKSSSSLSQFLKKYQWECLYTHHRFGREKSYYLTDLGQQLYELMKNNQTSLLEEEYTRYFDIKNDLENVISNAANDINYRVVKSDKGDFVESKIYAINDEDDSRKIELLAHISYNKAAQEEEREEWSVWQEKEA